MTVLVDERRPVLDWRESSSSDIERLLSRFGAAFLQGFLDPAAVTTLRRLAEQICAEREEKAALGALDERGRREFLRGSINYRELSARFPVEANSLLRPTLAELSRRWLGHEPTPLPITALRRVVPGALATVLPFHQDQTVTKKPSVNLWVALTPCGVTAPGLEMVVTERKELLETAPTESEFATNRAQIDPNLVLTMFGASSLWRPTFKPGDALVFTGTTVHRTHVTPAMTETRLDAEMRLV